MAETDKAPNRFTTYVATVRDAMFVAAHSLWQYLVIRNPAEEGLRVLFVCVCLHQFGAMFRMQTLLFTRLYF